MQGFKMMEFKFLQINFNPNIICFIIFIELLKSESNPKKIMSNTSSWELF